MTDILPVADLVDQHCHGVLRTELGLGTFEAGWRRPARRAGSPPPAPRSADPRRPAGFAAATAGLGSDLVLLHSYPYHRHAAQLASVHPHVYADVGAALTRTGARAAAVLAEILEPAPFGKLLFSSGAQGLPELHVVGARQFREALGRVLGDWVADGAWSRTDATRVAAMIASGNARRVYGLT